jgi:phosphoglycerol transferase MdoB-like AlkP superfamily enzyme
LPRTPGGGIIGAVLDRLKAFGRRTLAYNLQPQRLFLLPFTIAATVLGFSMLFSGNTSTTLPWVLIGLVVFVTVVDAAFWLVGHAREGHGSSSPRIR